MAFLVGVPQRLCYAQPMARGCICGLSYLLRGRPLGLRLSSRQKRFIGTRFRLGPREIILLQTAMISRSVDLTTLLAVDLGLVPVRRNITRKSSYAMASLPNVTWWRMCNELYIGKLVSCAVQLWPFTKRVCVIRKGPCFKRSLTSPAIVLRQSTLQLARIL